MKNKQEELKCLIERNEELKPIVFVSFKTDKELDLYRKKIHRERIEYFDNIEKIRQLE
jgi:hypothetical protein